MTKEAERSRGASAASAWITNITTVGELIDAVREVAQTVRMIVEQQTARVEIEARARVELAKVETIRSVLLAYLDGSFDERRSTFASLFERLDTALSSGNIETVVATLDAVVKLAQASPFKDLADVRSAKVSLEDKSRDWEF